MGVSNKTGKLQKSLNRAMLKNVDIVEAQGRTRLVFNLSSSASENFDINGKKSTN